MSREKQGDTGQRRGQGSGWHWSLSANWKAKSTHYSVQPLVSPSSKIQHNNFCINMKAISVCRLKKNLIAVFDDIASEKFILD